VISVLNGSAFWAGSAQALATTIAKIAIGLRFI
jgi:hypothetical protein